MPESRNFDPVADIYDRTRRLPDAVREVGIPAILDVIGPGARILDAGTGTGRIAVPLLEHGADVFGVDISLGMMARQRARSDRARLACASVTVLPFASASFDAVLTAHVIHLIASWRDALAEFRRVLRPGGIYLNVRSVANEDGHLRRAMRYWRDWVAARGGLPHGDHLGAWDQAEIDPVLIALGATVWTRDVVSYRSRYVLGERVQRLRERSYSSSWDVPEDLLAASADALSAWIVEEFGGLDVAVEDEEVFQIHAARFAG